MNRRLLLAPLLLCLALLASGCASTGTGPTIGKAALTPLTVVRDVVDAPLVSIACGLQYFGQQTRPAKAPHAGVGWNLFGGPSVGIGYDISWALFHGVAYTVGGVDYVVCRSLWPNWAGGISPLRHKGQSWGSLYFPNTRVLWGDHRPMHLREQRPGPPPPPAP